MAAATALPDPPSLPALDPRYRLQPVAKVLEALTGERPSPKKVSRMCLRGDNGARLRAARDGRRWLTTIAAVEAFFAEQAKFALARAGEGEPAAPPADPDAPHRATESKLRKRGLKE